MQMREERNTQDSIQFVVDVAEAVVDVVVVRDSIGAAHDQFHSIFIPIHLILILLLPLQLWMLLLLLLL